MDDNSSQRFKVNSPSHFFTMDRPYNEAVHWLKQRLSEAGLRVIQTFDLAVARAGLEDCPCSHHGTEQCDCEMIVLLVYGKSNEPVTLILHGNKGQSWLSLVSNAQQHPNPKIELVIEQTLQLNLSK